MLMRALMMNPLPLQAPAQRVVGRYLSKEGKVYDLAWDAATKRLNITYLAKVSGTVNGNRQYYQEVQTVVSSQARCAYRMSDGAVGLYDVSAAGLAETPAAKVAMPSPGIPGGSLFGINGNGDALFIASSTQSSPPRYEIRNLLTGASAISIGQTGYGGTSNTYNTGDGWITQIPSSNETGTQAQTADDVWTLGNVDITIKRPVDHGGLTFLATLASPSQPTKTLPLAGLPRVLPSANKIYFVNYNRVVSGSSVTNGVGTYNESLSQMGGGSIGIPTILTIDEVNVESNGSNYLVSWAKSTWYGVIVASMSGSNFVPLSVTYAANSNIVCNLQIQGDGSERYYTPNQSPVGAPTVGNRFLPFRGLAGSVAALGDASTRTVDIRTASLIVDAAQFQRGRTMAIPHLGAFAGNGPLFNTTDPNDLAKITISFDAGRTIIVGQRWGNDNPGGALRLGGGVSGIETGIPLFLV